MMKNLTLALIIEECNFRLERGQKELDKFIKNLTGGDEPEKANPVYAFQWGESAIAESVKTRAVKFLKGHAEGLIERVGNNELMESAALEQLLAYYANEMLYKARTTSRSTSALSNLVEDHERAVVAGIYGWLKGECFHGF